MSDDVLLTFAHAGVTYTRYSASQALARGVPQTTIDAAKTDTALAALAARRYRAETRGTTWEGHAVATTRDAQAQLLNAVQLSQADGFTSLAWKMADGVFVTLDADDIAAIKAAVDAHVAGCFANEQALQDAVCADGDADIEQGWPA